MTFDLQGQLLQSPEVLYSQFWTTHNVYSDIDGDVFETLKRDNSLSPIGRAFSIWSQFLGDEMVAATSSPSVRCFASQRRGKELCVFLLNKDTSPRAAEVELQRLPSELREGERWVWSGRGPSDREPTWTRAESVRVKDSRIAVRLEPVSLTVLQLVNKSDPRKRLP
jgi:hypothetical protein